MIAEPIPWTTRAPIRKLAFGARPHASEAPVKIARAMMKRRRRP
jgi:hypothetical protein